MNRVDLRFTKGLVDKAHDAQAKHLHATIPLRKKVAETHKSLTAERLTIFQMKADKALMEDEHSQALENAEAS